MKRTIIILTLALTAASCGGRRGANSGTGSADSLAARGITYPFTIDVSGDYPMEPISFQEVFGELEYIALETTPDCLIPDLPGLRSPVVTDSDIIICSGTNILRFGRDGKFRNRIGSEGRGPGEFLSATQMCVNAKTEEVFVYDVLSKVILVYGYEGRHKRTLRTDRNTIINDMDAITDSTLLVANQSNDSKKELAIYPFQLISSRNGSVVRSPMPPHEEPNAFIEMTQEQFNAMFSDKPDSAEGFQALGSGGMMRFDGSEPASLRPWNNIYHTSAGFELSEYVADTVWMVSVAGELTPRWVKQPPAMKADLAHRRYSGLRCETDKWAFFSAVGFGGGMGYKVDKADGTVTRSYLYDANLDHETTRRNRIIAPAVSTGRFAMPYQPVTLLSWLEDGKLSGELATLAATLKETDNPVLLISKKTNH